MYKKGGGEKSTKNSASEYCREKEIIIKAYFFMLRQNWLVDKKIKRRTRNGDEKMMQSLQLWVVCKATDQEGISKLALLRRWVLFIPLSSVLEIHAIPWRWRLSFSMKKKRRKEIRLYHSYQMGVRPGWHDIVVVSCVIVKLGQQTV